MNRHNLLLWSVASAIVIGGLVTGFLFVSGYAPKESAQPNVQKVSETNVTVEATYFEENESVRLTVTEGSMAASTYDFVWIENPEDGELKDATLRASSGGTIEGLWVDEQAESVTDFPLRSGDSVVVVRVDSVDDDLDGSVGVESGEYIHVRYGNHGESGAYEHKDLGYWKVENETVVRVTKNEFQNETG
jgi:hypothetical protein